MKAVIYCRVSTKEQTQNLSLPTQLKGCRDYCRREGYAIAREFVEKGESAKSADRTELQALLAYCRENKGNVQALVVYNVTRFARERYDHVVLRAVLQKLGVTLRSVTEPIDDSSTGKLMEGVLAAFAQFDNDQKAERTEAGMRAALQLGRWTFKAPLGYLNSNAEIGPSLVPDPSRAETVRLAFSLVADGRPAIDVLRQINASGLRAIKGGPLSLQSFRTMLRNPIYMGRVEVAKWGVSGAGDFEPLIGESVFRLVQRRLAGKASEPATHARDRADFPLRRFLRCNQCGKPVTGSWSKGRSGRYGYYHCPKCSGVRGRREDVENLFVARLERLKPAPAYMRLFSEVVLDVWRTEQTRAKDIEKIRTEHVSALALKLERLEEAFIYQRSIDRTTYEKQRDRIREELALAELELHDARIDSLDVEGVLGFADHMLGNAARIWVDANLEQRRQLQAAIFPEGLLFDGREFGTAPTCLAFLQLEKSEGSENGMASPGRIELPA
jgi:site-specific DNA recombinase